jgi:hypothetical protein
MNHESTKARKGRKALRELSSFVLSCFRDLFFLGAMLGPVVASNTASADEGSLPTKLEIFPSGMQLDYKVDTQSIVVQATYADGLTRDVTTEAKLAIDKPQLVQIEGSSIRPLTDGEAKLKAEFGGQSVECAVKTRNANTEPPLSFRLDVMPVFARAGCNTGSCHGASRGKDGFRLSLFGFDPEGDYGRITREMPGRRINLAVPKSSLLVEKAIGAVPHTGGTRFAAESELCQTLVRWIEAGAPNDSGDVPMLTGLELFPTSAVLNGPTSSQRLTVRAKYSDGHDRDVTRLAYLMSSNVTSAKVSPEGVVTAGERGEAFIMARFGDQTVGSQFIVLPKDLEFGFPEVPENNYVDALVNAKLRKLRIAPSDLCSDEVFLRRVYLDIVGLLPTAEEHQRFVGSADPQKRALLIDELLNRPEFVDLWVMKWSELLQVRTIANFVSRKATLKFHEWLRERIAGNMPVDQMIREVLTASGGSFSNPATNYFHAERNTLKIAENVAQAFMGMRVQCAQCHNHPFDRWTMNDYYSFAAFFARIGSKPGDDARERIVFDVGGGEVRHPVGGREMPPKFLGGEMPDMAGRDRRKVLAEWLTSAENPYFAKHLANTVWAHFFGRGIVEEVDDVRVSNPPVNAELLAELGKRFAAGQYDFKQLVRDICTSRTYQLATQTNESNSSDETNFSHGVVRRLRAEVLLDVISQATETQNKFPALPRGARAVQVADGATTNYFLTTFGRATRVTPCSCEVKMEPNLSQALHLLNGESIEQKIREGKLVDRRLKEGKGNHGIIDELYVRMLSRHPEPHEMNALLAALAQQPEVQKGLNDVFWALLNSREFLFNH